MKIKNVTSLDTNDLLKVSKDSIVIDVRTSKEWEEVGIPELGQNLILLSWRLLPNMSLNPDFEKNITNIVTNKNKNLFFLCKSGNRSLEAASFSANIGYVNCYNVSDGFEGSISGLGWKQNNLPWQIL